MASCEQDIWGKMLRVNPRGFLCWRPNIAGKIHSDPGKGTDPRCFPERYMAMCGRLLSLEEHHPIFDTSDLIQVAPQEFVTHEGEITGVNGLLRLANKFPISINYPERVLLVGAISPNSLLSVLAWCRENNWQRTHVSLVDNCLVPLETLRLMEAGCYYSWPGGIDLIESDITHYQPSCPPDIVIADILNPWMVDGYQYPHLDKCSPYSRFENFLRWGANVVGDKGWFLSRCVIFPSDAERSNPDLSKFVPIAQERTKQIMEQLGELGRSVNGQAIKESVEQLFEEPLRTTFCGLDKVSPLYRSERTLAGSHAEKVFRRFHYRSFQTTHEILVKDEKSRFRFLNFACQGTR